MDELEKMFEDLKKDDEKDKGELKDLVTELHHVIVYASRLHEEDVNRFLQWYLDGEMSRDNWDEESEWGHFAIYLQANGIDV